MLPVAPRSRIGIAQIFGGEEFADSRISVKTAPKIFFCISEIIPGKYVNNTNSEWIRRQAKSREVPGTIPG